MFNFLKKLVWGKNSIGLDIADHTIEVVELKKKNGVKIVSLGRVKIEPGIVERGRIKDEEKLLEAVKKVFSTAKPKPIIGKDIIFGLPESQVYTNVFVLKSGSRNERERLIIEQARKIIPISEEDLTYSYKSRTTFKSKMVRDKTLGHGQEGEEILLVATNKEVVLEWQNFFKKANLNVKIFDIETLAIFRALFIRPPEQPICIIDIGSETTNIAIFDKNGLRYSYSVLKAGDFFTQEIAKKLNIKPEKAEKKKLKADLTKNDQLAAILIKALEPILEEIKPSLTTHLFKNKKGDVQTNDVKDKGGGVILVGGSSQLKGLVDYLSSNLEVSVKLGKPALGGKNAGLLYLEAIGLALRGIDNKWNKKDPAIKLVVEAKNKIEKSKKRKVPFAHIDSVKKDFNLDAGAEESKFKKQKIILISILIIGLFVVGASFWYRSYKKSQKGLFQDTALQEYQFPKSIELKVPIAVVPEEYTTDRVRGRIISNEDERRPEEMAIKIDFEDKWLAYSISDAQNLFILETKKKINIDFILDTIDYQGVKTSDNSAIYFLKGQVNILAKQVFENEEDEKTVTENIEPEIVVEEIKEQVLIKDTPTDWLRVRQGPGTNYSEIAKVYPGEKYAIVEEKDNWVKIELSENEEGWVYDNYVEKVE